VLGVRRSKVQQTAEEHDGGEHHAKGQHHHRRCAAVILFSETAVAVHRRNLLSETMGVFSICGDRKDLPVIADRKDGYPAQPRRPGTANLIRDNS